MTISNESQKKKNTFIPIVAGIVIFFVGYHAYATVMYSLKLADFYEVEWSFSTYGLASNGQTSFGNMINIKELEAVSPGVQGGSSKEWCPKVTPINNNHITLGNVDELGVCCWASESQWLVPYKDKGEFRHYLCGKWPHLDEVKQPISKIRFPELEKEQK